MRAADGWYEKEDARGGPSRSAAPYGRGRPKRRLEGGWRWEEGAGRERPAGRDQERRTRGAGRSARDEGEPPTAFVQRDIEVQTRSDSAAERARKSTGAYRGVTTPGCLPKAGAQEKERGDGRGRERQGRKRRCRRAGDRGGVVHANGAMELLRASRSRCRSGAGRRARRTGARGRRQARRGGRTVQGERGGGGGRTIKGGVAGGGEGGEAAVGKNKWNQRASLDGKRENEEGGDRKERMKRGWCDPRG